MKLKPMFIGLAEGMFSFTRGSISFLNLIVWQIHPVLVLVSVCLNHVLLSFFTYHRKLGRRVCKHMLLTTVSSLVHSMDVAYMLKLLTVD